MLIHAQKFLVEFRVYASVLRRISNPWQHGASIDEGDKDAENARFASANPFRLHGPCAESPVADWRYAYPVVRAFVGVAIAANRLRWEPDFPSRLHRPKHYPAKPFPGQMTAHSHSQWGAKSQIPTAQNLLHLTSVIKSVVNYGWVISVMAGC